MAALFLLVATVVLPTVYCSAPDEFRFANTLGSNMVLQQTPYKSQIWGFAATNGSSIDIQLMKSSTNAIVQHKTAISSSDNIWMIQFDPMIASFETYTIKATSSGKSIEMSNILFGDVIFCGGQSNMQFTVDQAFNATQNTEEANNYPNIRVFTAENNMKSDTVQTELPSRSGVMEPWSIASSKSIGCGNWTCFSAVCWFTGLNLFKELNYPIGLISSTYGGTPIRSWMPYDTASQCDEDINANGFAPSVCWNAMIAPFLRTTIRFALWYQGEQDTKQHPFDYGYACSFPLMIRSWRHYWSQNSGTDPSFPFGFVQISVFLDSERNITCGNNQSVECLGAANVRWGQTANATYLFNESMPNTFFATAIDLGDPDTPFVAPLGPVHPRYKKPIGDRLTDGAMNVVYGETDRYFGGPYAVSAMYNDTTKSVSVKFRNIGNEGILIKNYIGFELYDENIGWFNAFENIEANGHHEIDIKVPSDVSYSKITEIRYNFFTAPCLPFDGPYQCAIYDQEHDLPAVPFTMNVS